MVRPRIAPIHAKEGEGERDQTLEDGVKVGLYLDRIRVRHGNRKGTAELDKARRHDYP